MFHFPPCFTSKTSSTFRSSMPIPSEFPSIDSNSNFANMEIVRYQSYAQPIAKQLLATSADKATNSGSKAYCSSPKAARSIQRSKTLAWCDTRGQRLCQAMEFRTEDETWRCSKYQARALLSSIIGSNASSGVDYYTTLNATLPTSSIEVYQKLSTKAVQLESITSINTKLFV